MNFNRFRISYFYAEKLNFSVMAVILFTIIFQLFLIANFSENDISILSGDPRYYLKLIMQKVDENSFYPSQNDIYSNFMFAPGFINYGVGVIKVFHNPRAFLYLNLAFTLIISLELFSITKIVADEKSAKIAVLIFLLSVNNQGISLFLLTQLPFAVLLLLTIYFVLRKSSLSLVVAGVALVLTNWIRPVGLFLIISVVIFFILSNYPKKAYLYFILGIIISAFLICTISFNNSGFVVYQSSTEGINMRMGAHEKSNGGYIGEPYSDPNISEKMNFIERNNAWKGNAINWIKNNPTRFIQLAPLKIVKLFGFDAYTLNGFKIVLKNLQVSSLIAKNINRAIFLFSMLHYFLIVILMLINLYCTIIKKNKFFIFIWIFIFMNIFISILTVGESIYRHHITVLSCIISAITINMIIEKWKAKNKKMIHVL